LHSPRDTQTEWREFSKFDLTISIINGSDDSRYKLAGKMMSEMNKQATQHVVDNSNHNVHLESTDAFIDLIK
jgi:pimeloyl-ACP methyl ester carboxylesterase